MARARQAAALSRPIEAPVDQAGRDLVPPRTLLLLGDSILGGWGVPESDGLAHLLQREMDRRQPHIWRVVNAGVPGDTVLMGHLRWRQELCALRPQLVCLGFGLNDGALRRTSFDAERERLWRAKRCPVWRIEFLVRRWFRMFCGRRGSGLGRCLEPRVRPRLFLRAYSSLLRRLSRANARIVVLPFHALDAKVLGDAQMQSYDRYDRLIRRMVRRHGAALVNLDRRNTDPDPHTMRCADGIHLSAEGYRWLASRMIECVVVEPRPCV